MSVTVIPDQGDAFQPLFPDQDEDTILARWLDWANEGIDPVADADEWVDTREGGHWRTCAMPAIREFARVYDLLSEVAMCGFVLWAWEVYLDDLAAQWDVERLSATQAQGTVTFTTPVSPETPEADIGAGTAVSVVPSTPEDPAPTFIVQQPGVIPTGGGSVDLPVLARDAGVSGNVAAGAIIAPETPLPAVTEIVNAAATFGGRDVEDDDSLRDRTLDAVKGQGPGAVRDYFRWAGNWPGVGRVQVVPVWDGASTVLVMISDPQGLPVPDALVAALQQDLDPVAGKGSGTAPVGAHVTVADSSPRDIDIAASIVFEPGYSWDGSGLTAAVGPDVQIALSKYLLGIAPGDEAVYDRLRGIFATWPGVHDLAAFTVNGATANIRLSLSPAQTAILGTITVS